MDQHFSERFDRTKFGVGDAFAPRGSIDGLKVTICVVFNQIVKKNV